MGFVDEVRTQAHGVRRSCTNSTPWIPAFAGMTMLRYMGFVAQVRPPDVRPAVGPEVRGAVAPGRLALGHGLCSAIAAESWVGNRVGNRRMGGRIRDKRAGVRVALAKACHSAPRHAGSSHAHRRIGASAHRRTGAPAHWRIGTPACRGFAGSAGRGAQAEAGAPI